MRDIVLIACAAKKAPQRARARDLYCSPLFRLSLHYGESLLPYAINVLSAKYGLIDIDQVIDPYDLTLKDMRSSDVKAWGERVLASLRERYDLFADRFVFLAGATYRKYLTPELTHYEVPLEGLTIGRQLQWLTQRS